MKLRRVNQGLIYTYTVQFICFESQETNKTKVESVQLGNTYNADLDKCPQDKCCLEKCCGDSSNLL